ncbi:MarR family transcriptional regulator [Candidatus Entotheonella serta]|nr:MarR family transcriptional regulator [Candidatus Entotheonella serta]
MTKRKNTAMIITRDCLAARIRLLNRQILRLYDDALRPFGIKVTQLSVLAALERLGPSSPSEVTKVLDMEKSTLSRNLERLRTRGWIEVQPGLSGRTQQVAVTDQGRELLEQALPEWEAAQEQAAKLLGANTTAALYRLPTANWA